MSNKTIESIISSRRHCSVTPLSPPLFPHLSHHRRDIAANYLRDFFKTLLYAFSSFLFLPLLTPFSFSRSLYRVRTLTVACYRESTMSCVIDVIDEARLGWGTRFILTIEAKYLSNSCRQSGFRLLYNGERVSIKLPGILSRL